MKSKTFFSDFAQTQFKKQLWIMGLMTFFLLLVLPFSLMIEIGNLEYAGLLLYQRQSSYKVYTIRSEMQMLVIMASAFLTAVYQFRYLHSRKMVDFYHSLPIRREQIFKMHVVTAYLDFVIPYTLATIICILLGLARGLATLEAIGIYVLVWLLYQIVFLLIYMVTAVAMLLTGREFVGILGAGVLLFFPLVISAALDWYQSEFFSTYTGDLNTTNWLYSISPGYIPVILRRIFLKLWANDQAFDNRIFIMLAITIGFIVLSVVVGYYLIKRRPSEAAGSSMAFAFPARVIHIFLSILGALYIGMFVYGMTNYESIVWLMAGVAFGGLVLYILIQFIYTIDFRRVLQYKWQLLLTEAVSLGIAAMFCFDWIGFDSYIPEKENLYSVAFSIQDGYQYETYLMSGRSVNAEEYRMDHMNLVVTNELYDMLEETVEKNAQMKTGVPVEDNYYALPVRYKLKNGRERNREYRINLEEYRDLFASLYDQAEFKNIMMPMYGLFTSDSEYEITLGYEQESIQLFGNDQKKAWEFIQILKKDFEKRDGKTFVNEIPIATIRVNAKKLSHPYHLYIYPSSTCVLSYLADSGYAIETRLTVENILKIDIQDERIYEKNIEEIAEKEMVEGDVDQIKTDSMLQATYTTYTDPEEIAQIIPALVSYEYDSIWIPTCEGLYATVTYIGKDGYQMQMNYAVLQNKLPELLIP